MNMIDQFLSYHRAEEHSQKTCETYREELELLGKHLDCPIEDATKIQLWDYVGSISHLKPATRAKKINTIRSFYRWLNEIAEYREDNPSVKLHAPKIKESPPKYMEHEEVMELKSRAADPIMATFIDVMYATGIRISEAIELNKNDVLWQSGKIRVKGKGGKIREVPISATALASLQRYLNRRRDSEEALFINKKCKRLCPRTVQLYLKKLGNEVNIERLSVSPHKLRHSFATTLRSNDVAIDTISLWMGHSDLKTTMRYAKVVDAKQMSEYRNALPDGM